MDQSFSPSEGWCLDQSFCPSVDGWVGHLDRQGVGGSVILFISPPISGEIFTYLLKLQNHQYLDKSILKQHFNHLQNIIAHKIIPIFLI